MEPITLIMTALVAGAAAAVQDGVKETVKDGYKRLRDAVKARFRGDQAAELALAEHESDPRTWEAPLAAKLTELGAGDDIILVETARALLAAVDEEGAHAPKYNITITDSRGVQSGDHNTQTNTF